MKILVADDDRLAVSLMTAILGKLGHQDVVTAQHGSEAWHLFKEQPVRLVISDWMMPGMEGVEMCRRIRADTQRPYTYVILVTSRDDKPSFAQGMAAGADDFLTKPVDIGVLAARLRVAERILSLQRQVGELKAILPICIYCRKIRTDDEAWERIERYLAENTDLSLSDSVCRECYEVHLAKELDGL